MPKGLILLFTGPGKGKTTAALGLLLRAWGQGLRVCMLQFLKSEDRIIGERLAAQKLGLEWHTLGDGFTWRSKDIAETKAKAQQAWALAQEKIGSKQYDLIVLDEFTYPLNYGWLAEAEVITWLQQHKPAALHLALTGRKASPALIAIADLVTEMQNVKHHLAQGISAQRGIEF